MRKTVLVIAWLIPHPAMAYPSPSRPPLPPHACRIPLLGELVLVDFAEVGAGTVLAAGASPATVDGTTGGLAGARAGEPAESAVTAGRQNSELECVVRLMPGPRESIFKYELPINA